MDDFSKLLSIADTLMGPDGCPWDREQTFASLRSTLLEEACEVIEAIDEAVPHKLAEELGDLLFNFVFLCKIAEKEGLFKTEEVIDIICEKLIRRHPHVFGEAEVANSEEVLKQWEEIKLKEKSHSDRKSVLDGIPKGLPALARAFKMSKQMSKKKFEPAATSLEWIDEDSLGEALFSMAWKAHQKKLDPEQALRKVLIAKEREFREWEP